MKTDVWGRKFIISSLSRKCYGFMESFQKIFYKLNFVDFWGYLVTFIFGYISSTTWSNTKFSISWTHGIVHCNLCLRTQLFHPLFLVLRMSRKITVLAQKFLRMWSKLWTLPVTCTPIIGEHGNFCGSFFTEILRVFSPCGKFIIKKFFSKQF